MQQGHLQRDLKVTILPPAFFFDTLFKYDSNRSAASIVKNLADSGGDQEPQRVKQPFALDGEKQEQDLSEYLLQKVHEQSRATSPMLWVVSAPAGYGKSIMFASLFHKVYRDFQDAKREQRPFPRPLPMIAEHLRFSAGPNIKGLIDAFVQTDFAGHTPPELFTWMIDQGHGFWMIDGLDEVVAGDDDFLEFLLDRLTQPSSSAPLILIALRDSLLQSREELHELVEMGGDVVNLIELLPWTYEQKRSFSWVKVHERLPQERDRDDSEVRDLLRSLTQKGHIDALSSTPFYADMLADEFQQDSAVSPRDEFDLLDLAVSAMCRREYAKDGPIQESVLPLAAFRDWLENVAAEIVSQSGIPTDELRTLSELILVLTASEETMDGRAETQLVDQMMVMPFLKSSPDSGKFEFTHEILGDFLAGSFYARRMEDGNRGLDWGSKYLGQQALLGDSMLLTRVLLIRLTHHATRCSVSWWRFAGRVKTAIPENTLGISVPVRN